MIFLFHANVLTGDLIQILKIGSDVCMLAKRSSSIAQQGNRVQVPPSPTILGHQAQMF